MSFFFFTPAIVIKLSFLKGIIYQNKIFRLQAGYILFLESRLWHSYITLLQLLKIQINSIATVSVLFYVVTILSKVIVQTNCDGTIVDFRLLLFINKSVD